MHACLLHWLPVEDRLRYKLCLLMHMVHTERCPPYLADILHPVSSSSGRSGLQSATTAQYVEPKLRTVFGERAFLFAGQKACNDLPSHLHTATTTDSFKRQIRGTLAWNLTTYFFGQIRKLTFCQSCSNIFYQTNPNFSK